MNANAPITPDVHLKQQERSRRRKAILAGGVVLGLGAATTLAAWSDDVFADGIFNTGAFELQGSLDGETFFDYDGPAPAGTASLSFNLSGETMTPSQTVYAPLTIATDSNSDHAGNFRLQSVSAAGKYAGVLTYRAFTEETHGANCSSANAANLEDGWTVGVTLPSPLPAVSRPVIDVAPLTSPLTLPVGAKGGTPVQHLCLAVTMGGVTLSESPLDPIRVANQLAVTLADNAPGATEDPTTVTWVFNGQLTDI